MYNSKLRVVEGLIVFFMLIVSFQSLKAQQNPSQTERVRQARERLERAEARLSKVYDELSSQYAELKNTKGTEFFKALEDAIRGEATSEDVAVIEQEARKKVIKEAGKAVLKEQITKQLIPSLERRLIEQGIPPSLARELAPRIAQEMAGRIVKMGFTGLDYYNIGRTAAMDVVLVKRNLTYHWKYFFEGLPAKREYEAALEEYRAALEEAMNASGSSANSLSMSIDSRANSLMIDQVTDAKNTRLTIGHTYRISLKSDAVPIGDRVCIMYQSQERGLTFDVLTDRAPISFTAAYFNFYAWLMDWINRSDNSGSAVVTIQDMTDNTRVTLAIDSRDESLMVDQQPGCKFTELISGKSYTATLNGDATPIGDRIFVMFQSQERGFTFDVLTKGSPLTFTAGPDPTFCAFLTDWVNRNDNTGEAVITFTPK